MPKARDTPLANDAAITQPTMPRLMPNFAARFLYRTSPESD
jgi:hypothetical protein